jgi:phosphatidylserine/phosphatidylglycerophosphate/cardiolipin synthase-like enzyme
MNLTPLKILPTEQYFAELAQAVASTKPGDRVALMSMSFNPVEPRTAPLFWELISASKRGVQVQLNVDANSFMVDDAKTIPSGPLFWHNEPSRSRRQDYRAKFETLSKLLESGGHYCITNMPNRALTNPFSGRSHIKFSVINNTTYVGGCNLSKSWQTDLMVRLDDPNTADFIYQFMMQVARAGNVLASLDGKDMVYQIDELTKLAIDAGHKHQSLIYEEALKAIDDAKQWIVLTCQYFPGSTTADHLAAALQRGVRVEVHYGRQSGKDFLSLPHHIVELGEQIRYPKELFVHRVEKSLPRLHTKLLATEQGAMLGSHNYVTHGVDFGTAEATLIRQDPAFAQIAVDIFKASLTKREQRSA